MAYDKHPSSYSKHPASVSQHYGSIGKHPASYSNHPSAASVINFATVASSNGATVLQSIQSDLGVTSSSGLVSTWADQSGNGKDYTAAGTARPTITASVVNGFPAISFDGVATVMTSALTLPAPGTTPTYLWMLVRQLTWVASTGFAGQANATAAHTVWQSVAANNIVSFNGTANLPNTSATLNTWFRVEVQWSNSTSDYVKVGATNATGTNAGNNASASSREFGRYSTGANFSKFDALALMYCSGTPNSTVRNALNSAVATKYGGLVAT